MAFDTRNHGTPKFVYKQGRRTIVRARAARRGGRFNSIWQDGVDTIRLKEGDNMLVCCHRPGTSGTIILSVVRSRLRRARQRQLSVSTQA